MQVQRHEDVVAPATDHAIAWQVSQLARVFTLMRQHLRVLGNGGEFYERQCVEHGLQVVVAEIQDAAAASKSAALALGAQPRR